MAARARGDVTTLGATAAVAVVAGSEAVVGNGLRASGGRLGKRDAQRDAHVAASRAGRPATGGTAAKEGGEDVVHAKAAEDVGDVNTCAPEAAEAVWVAITVVVGALLLVGEHRVRLVDLLELLLGVRGLVHVRVKGPGLLEKRTLDGPGVRITVNAKHLVVVDLSFHARSTRFPLVSIIEVGGRTARESPSRNRLGIRPSQSRTCRRP